MKLISFLFGASLVLAEVSLAQETNAPNVVAKPAPPPAVRRDRPTGAGPRSGALLGRNLDVLTPEQRNSWRTAMSEQRDQLRQTETRLVAARKELFEATIASPFDEAAVRQKAAMVASLQAEGMVLQAKALSQVKPPLSKEQIEKMRATDTSVSSGEGAPNAQLRIRRQNGPAPSTDENGLPPKQ